jgi:hypothetical protein
MKDTMPRNINTLIIVLAAALATGSAAAAGTFAKDVDALHAVLAPLWHAKPGKERSQNTCAQAAQMEQLTREIHSGDTKTLLASISTLKAQCETNPNDIDAAFSHVHDAFHHLAEPGGH